MGTKYLFRLVFVSWLFTLSFTAADLPEKLNNIVDKEETERTQPVIPAIIPLLKNLSDVIWQIHNSLGERSTTLASNRIERQALLGCHLIPTDDLNGGKPTYFLCKQELNWHVADQHCKIHRMRLAVMDTSAKFSSISRYLKYFMANAGFQNKLFLAWIGGSDLGNEGNWYWAPNGKLIVSNDWGPGQPDNNGGNEHCLLIWRKQNVENVDLNDGICHKAYWFICEQE